MGFNRWSPHNYGTNNTNGMRLSSYDANEQRLFESLRQPIGREDWLATIDLMGQVWKQALEKEVWKLREEEDEEGKYPQPHESTFIYQKQLLVAGYYLAISKHDSAYIYSYLGLIHELVSDLETDSIFEESLENWAKKKNYSPDTGRSLPSPSMNRPGLLGNEFQCSNCYLILHNSMMSKRESKNPRCHDCC